MSFNGSTPIPDVSGIDLSKLNSPYKTKKSNSGPDFINYSNSKGTSIVSRMFLYTGVSWLGGFMVAGTVGGINGWRNAVNPSFSIKLNSVLNNFSKHGSKVGNAMGAIAFLHITSLWIMQSIKVDDILNSEFPTPMIAGLMTGAIYKSTKGLRAASLAAAIGTVASTCLWFGGSYVVESLTPRRGRRY